MDFFVFLLVNATLFIRPQEIIEGFPVDNPYLMLIILNLALSAGPVLSQFSFEKFRRNPLTVGVVGIFAAILLSHLSHLNLSMAWDGGVDFAKVLLYYTLFISVINTPVRLRRFVGAIVLFTSALSALALLQHYGVIDLKALGSVGDREIDPVSGEEYILMRICSTGVFHDPNDLASILIVATWMSVYLAGDRGAGPFRFIWLAPLILFGDAFTKTQSRGGFLGLVGSFGIMFVSRLGIRKAIPLLTLALPVLVVVFAGRQTSISATEDTGQDRIKLWAEGFQVLKNSPLFGIGRDRMADEVGLVAHNSFIHGFVELGIFGGPLFLGLFYYALSTLYELRGDSSLANEPELARLRPYLLTIVSGYAICTLTLSRNYVVPTYMIVGLVAAYLGIIGSRSARSVPAFDGRLLRRIYTIGIIFLVLANLFTRVFVHYH